MIKDFDPSSFGFDALDLSKRLYPSVSGGKDSTAFALALYQYVKDKDSDVVLLFEDTLFNSKAARDTIQRLSDVTGFSLETVKYEGEEPAIDIIKESFRAIPKAIEAKEILGRSYKQYFYCCDKLKKRPVRNFLNKHEPSDIVVMLGFRGDEKALHRRYRLRQLRDANTFFRKKKSGYWYFYPLRDKTEKDVMRILQNFDFADVQSSGCGICPIFCIADWDDRDPDVALRSKKYAKLLGVELRAENQMSIRDFCSEVEG